MKNIPTCKPTALKGRIVMVMDRISGFSNLSQGILKRFQGSAGTDSTDPATSGLTGQDKQSAPADRADISDAAHRLMALRQAVDTGKEALEELPEVRQDKVARARERLNKGFYNSIEVRSQVAERLDGLARKLEDI